MWRWKEQIIFCLSFFVFTKVVKAFPLKVRSSRFLIPRPWIIISLWSCKSIFIFISVPQIYNTHTKHQLIRRTCLTIVISGVIAVASVSRSSCMSLNQDVAHSFDVFAPIVKPTRSSCVSTRVGIVRISCCTKPSYGVIALAIVFVVPNVTNSCSGSTRAISTETFFDAFALQGGV